MAVHLVLPWTDLGTASGEVLIDRITQDRPEVALIIADHGRTVRSDSYIRRADETQAALDAAEEGS